MEGWTVDRRIRRGVRATRASDGACVVVFSDTPEESLKAVLADLEQPAAPPASPAPPAEAALAADALPAEVSPTVTATAAPKG